MGLFLANTGSSTAALYKFMYTRLNAFKRRSMKRKITRMKESFTKADMENSVYEESMQPNEPIGEASNQSSKKSKISMKSFRFKSPDDQNKMPKKKDSQTSEKKTKKAEKKIQEVDEIPNNKKDQQRSDEAPGYDTHKFEADVLKRMDGLIEGDNSIHGDNVSLPDCGQMYRSETFENNLKSVIENDDLASVSSGSDNEEINNRYINNKSSLIPNLFIKTKHDCPLNTIQQNSSIKSKTSAKSFVSNVSKCSSTNSEPSPFSTNTASEPPLLQSSDSNPPVKETVSSKPKNNKFKFFAKSFNGFNKKSNPTSSAAQPNTTETVQDSPESPLIDNEPVKTISESEEVNLNLETIFEINVFI